MKRGSLAQIFWICKVAYLSCWMFCVIESISCVESMWWGLRRGEVLIWLCAHRIPGDSEIDAQTSTSVSEKLKTEGRASLSLPIGEPVPLWASPLGKLGGEFKLMLKLPLSQYRLRTVLIVESRATDSGSGSWPTEISEETEEHSELLLSGIVRGFRVTSRKEKKEWCCCWPACWDVCKMFRTIGKGTGEGGRKSRALEESEIGDNEREKEEGEKAIEEG